MNITYRQAIHGDEALLAEIRVRLINEDSGPLGQEEREALYSENRVFMQESLQNGSFFAYLALDGERPVGTCGCCLYRVLPGRKLPGGKNAYIQNVFVDPEYRRQGIAKCLVERTISRAKEQGCGRITLHATRAGRLLFEHCGFTDESGLGLTQMIYR